MVLLDLIFLLVLLDSTGPTRFPVPTRSAGVISAGFTCTVGSTGTAGSTGSAGRAGQGFC